MLIADLGLAIRCLGIKPDEKELKALINIEGKKEIKKEWKKESLRKIRKLSIYFVFVRSSDIEFQLKLI